MVVRAARFLSEFQPWVKVASAILDICPLLEEVPQEEYLLDHVWQIVVTCSVRWALGICNETISNVQRYNLSCLILTSY